MASFRPSDSYHSRLAWIVALACGVVFSSTPIAWAGTTGGLNGTLFVTGTTQPIVGASVTASSPSQTLTTHTDPGGHFTFVSLSPDTYEVTATAAGYDPVSVSGITIQADNVQTIGLTTQHSVRVLGKIVTRAAALVKPGTTANVYSVTAATQDIVAGLGGGGYLNNAASAIASVPGAFVPQGQNGIYPSIFIRGGNYTQVGYEYDGVPLQRAFDQYPGADLATLGQQELQVYTGAAPVNSDSTALAGFVNQVIKGGTYPGFAAVKFSDGVPVHYGNMQFEMGGASPDRLFTYYAGFGGFSENLVFENDHEFDALYGGVLNIYRGSSCSSLVSINKLAGCYKNSAYSSFPLGPTGFQYGPIFWGSRDWFTERDNVVNLHFGVPHHRDNGRDDIQVLLDNSWQRTLFAARLSDFGAQATDVFNGTVTLPGGTVLPQCASSASVNCNLFGSQAPYFRDADIFTGQVGVPLSFAQTFSVADYWFPGSPTNRNPATRFDELNNCPGIFCPSTITDVETEGDSYNNNSAIFKIQYQHNMGSNAFLRIFGYTNYSDWLQYAPGGLAPDFYGSVSQDYKLGAHTRGIAANFTDQLTDKHLINVNGSFTVSHTFRDNAGTYNAAISTSQGAVAYMVDSTDPTSGQCYRKTGLVTVAPVNCLSSLASRYRLDGFGAITLVRAHTSGATADPTVNNVGTFTCGNGPCEYFIVGNGISSVYNTVSPQFWAGSVQDTWKPNTKLTFTFGLRYDDFRYLLVDTNRGPARQFWVNFYNKFTCFDPVTQSFPLGSPSTSSTPLNCPTVDPMNPQFQNLAFSSTSLPFTDYPEFQPRFGMTFAPNASDVFRVSAGKYAQPASSAFQQYDTQQPNMVAGTNLLFYTQGFHSPSHLVYPEESYTADLSWEHQTAGDVSWSLTPYFRRTHNELTTITLDPKTNFVSSINVGTKTVKGLEFIIRKGDVLRNGLYAQLSYTYTDAHIKFGNLPNGQSIATALNLGVSQYNAFTSFCMTNFSDPRCGTMPNGTPLTSPPATATACFGKNVTNTAVIAVACGAPGAVANPYWNAPAQPLFDPNADYAVYSRFAGSRPLTGSSDSYLVPHVLTVVLNYKRNRWNFTPTIQMQAGNRYGRPLDVIGIDPSAFTRNAVTGKVANWCMPLPSGTTAGDPRYQFGAAGGAPYDASFCPGSGISIPDPYTGVFDNFGAFVEPTKVGANFQISYQLNDRIKLSALGVNVFTGCYGGSNVPWKVTGYSKAGCVYSGQFSTGNYFNPGDALDPQFKYPYGPVFGSVFQSVSGAQNDPFEAYFTMEVKI